MPGLIDILFASVDEVRHEANDLARREVIPRFFVGLFVEAHHQMLEQIAHLKVIDPVRMKIDIGHRLDDCEEAVAGVELLDLIGELETLEDVAAQSDEKPLMYDTRFGAMFSASPSNRAKV